MWHNKTQIIVSDLVSKLEKFTESGYVDKEIWTYLSSKIDAAALPVSNFTLR